jgi:hypothetical protein
MLCLHIFIEMKDTTTNFKLRNSQDIIKSESNTLHSESFRTRYWLIAQSEWFKETYYNKTIGDIINIEQCT